MIDEIKIGCPQCGARLKVKNQKGIEFMSLTCPVCKKKSAFNEYTRKPEEAEDEKTEYGGIRGEHTTTGQECNSFIGQLRMVSTNRIFELKPGLNIIGRQSEVSKATCQIPDESKHMSREHLVIDVKHYPKTGYVHYVCLYKERVNSTFVDKEKLVFGDRIILNHMNKLKLADIILRFEIPEDTLYSNTSDIEATTVDYD